MITIESSSVRSVGRDSDTGEFLVQYKSDLYRWDSIEESDYNDLLKAESKGKFLHSTIERKYGKGTKVTRHTTTEDRVGYLVETNKREYTNSKIKPDTREAYCPSCQTEAQGFIPPIEDQKYLDRMKIEKDLNNLETDEQAHLSYLKASGGYIETCHECGTSYFVSSRLAHLKVEQV